MRNQRPTMQLHQVQAAWSNLARCTPSHNWIEANSLGAFVTPEFAALTEAWLAEAGALPTYPNSDVPTYLTPEGTCISCGRWDNCPDCDPAHIADMRRHQRNELEHGAWS